jgi:hypothetical protein
MRCSLSKLPCRENGPARRREHGSAVLVVLVVLSIMLIYVNANLTLLSQLRSELKLIEQRQLEKFVRPPSVSLSTNSATREASAAVNPATSLPPASPAGAESEKRDR